MPERVLGMQAKHEQQGIEMASARLVMQPLVKQGTDMVKGCLDNLGRIQMHMQIRVPPAQIDKPTVPRASGQAVKNPSTPVLSAPGEFADKCCIQAGDCAQ